MELSGWVYPMVVAPTSGGRDNVKVWPTSGDDLVEISGSMLNVSVVQSGAPRLMAQVVSFTSGRLRPTAGSNDRVRLVEPVAMSVEIGTGWQVE